MSAITLKSLHNYLKLLENPSELKRRLPTSSNPRTLKEGLYEMSRLVGVDEAVFKDPQTIAALIGAQRFVMIWGEPSVTDHVARVFDNSRLLLTGLVSALSFESAAASRWAPVLGRGAQWPLFHRAGLNTRANRLRLRRSPVPSRKPDSTA